jgi:hypothetical protein
LKHEEDMQELCNIVQYREYKKIFLMSGIY